MSSTFPPGFESHIAAHIRQYGEEVTFTPNEPEGSDGVTIMAIVARPGIQPLIGDMIQDGYSVFVAGVDMPQKPSRFDRLTIDGLDHAIEAPMAHRGGGVVLAWEMRVLGG